MGGRGPRAKDDGLFSDPRRGQELGVSLTDCVILFCFTQYQQVMGGVGEMRSNRTFVFYQLFVGCEHARFARTSQHRFAAGVFLVSAKKGAIIYPGDFFQRPGNC